MKRTRRASAEELLQELVDALAPGAGAESRAESRSSVVDAARNILRRSKRPMTKNDIGNALRELGYEPETRMDNETWLWWRWIYVDGSLKEHLPRRPRDGNVRTTMVDGRNKYIALLHIPKNSEDYVRIYQDVSSKKMTYRSQPKLTDE